MTSRLSNRERSSEDLTALQDPDTPVREEHRRFRIDFKYVLFAVIGLVIAYLTLTPFIYLFTSTFVVDGQLNLDGFTRAFGTFGFGEMVTNSLLFTVLSTLIAIAIGTLVAYLVVRTDVRFKPLIVLGAIIPLIMPSMLYAIGWIAMFTPTPFRIFGLPGMIGVEATNSVPMAFLFMYTAFRQMDPSLEESALVSGASRVKVFFTVTLPLARVAVASAALILGVRALESFEVPTLLGLPNRDFVFTSRIYYELRQFPIDVQSAGSLSIGLILIAMLGVYLNSRSTGPGNDRATVTGKGFRPQPMELGRARMPVTLVVLLYFFIAALLPLLFLVYNSLSPRIQALSFEGLAKLTFNNYLAAFAEPTFGRASINSIVLSLLTATIVMVITALAAWLILRSRIRGVKILDHLAFLPMIIPGIVVGVAISFIYLRNPLPFAVYGTILILLIAYVTRFMPYGMRYSIPALSQISSELEESSAVSGASWFSTLRRIIIPLMFPGLLAGWIFIVIVSIRELASSILLYSSGTEVISVLMWQFNDVGRPGVVAAIGTMLMIFLSILAGIAYKLGVRVGI